MKYWISGNYNLQDGSLTTSSMSSPYINGEYYLELIGNIGYRGESVGLEQVAELFKKYKIKAICQFTGIFLLLIYDRVNKKLFVFHDKTTSALNFYYTQNGETVYFSTSLKRVLLNSKIIRKLDLYAASQLFANGIIINRNTLVKNVYKLEFFHYLYLSRQATFQKKISYFQEEILSETEAKSLWDKVITHSILNHVSSEEPDVSIALSSGYDSNFILHTINSNLDKKINAFTVGGSKSTNELPEVKKIAKQYNNVHLAYKVINKFDLREFPEIIWRLEGSVLECGILLQYALAQLAYVHNIKHIICGECADEVMNPKYFDITLPVYEYDKNVKRKLSFIDNPFYMTNLLIMKKSSIMLNSFGIESHYPYKDNRVLVLAKSLGKVNGFTKEYHKFNCQNVIPPLISQHIKNIGGATAFMDLLPKEKFQQLRNYIIKNNVEFFFASDIGLELNEYNERTVDKLFRYLYIILFKDLFISGKYSSDFEEEAPLFYNNNEFYELL